MFFIKRTHIVSILQLIRQEWLFFFPPLYVMNRVGYGPDIWWFSVYQVITVCINCRRFSFVTQKCTQNSGKSTEKQWGYASSLPDISWNTLLYISDQILCCFRLFCMFKCMEFTFALKQLVKDRQGSCNMTVLVNT